MERKLASIQKIADLRAIEGADKIEVATILGWHCVVSKGEFKVGDPCVFFEVDSLLPVKPEYEFLRKSCYNPRLNGFRIKTVKMRGQVSQGLALPVTVLNDYAVPQEGTDLTDFLFITKYEAPIPAEMQGKIKGTFPSFIPRTDEPRLQGIPSVIERYSDVLFYETEKLDGTSLTVFLKDDYFGICSRKNEWLPEDNNLYVTVAKQYHMEERLRALGQNLAVQGEIIGPGIQGNKYGLAEREIRVFSIYSIDQGCYLSFDCYFKTFCVLRDVVTTEELKICPATRGVPYTLGAWQSVDELVEHSKGMSLLNPSTPREGLVIRAMVEQEDSRFGRLSFKIINPTFLLGEKDE